MQTAKRTLPGSLERSSVSAELTRLGVALEASVEHIVAASAEPTSPGGDVDSDLAQVRRVSTVAVARWLAGGEAAVARQVGDEASGIFARLAFEHRVPLDDMTKRCLRWRDTVTDYLCDTAQRLDTGSEALRQALAMIQRSTDVTLVRMCQNFETDRRASQERIDTQHHELVHRATHDALTGLPNRAAFHNQLDSALLTTSRLAVLLLDLDRFKDINDTLGHACGDELLNSVAGRLARATRSRSVLSRLGGDEFAVLVPDAATVADAHTVAERLLDALGEPFHIGGISLNVGASIGVAVAPDHGHDTALLIQRADCAMYQAKRSTSRVAVYDPAIDHNTLRRLSLIHDLRHAINDDQMVLHYQPKLGLATRHPVGVEALVRWNHPRFGLLGPDHFVPLAETGGVIQDLTDWVIRHALIQLSRWRSQGIDLDIAVNVAAGDFDTHQLADTVFRSLAATSVPADRLILELTERVVMADLPQTRTMMNQLRNKGIRISLDDFGTGYSSLSYLGALPVDELKIDRSFLSENPTDTRRTVLANIIHLGRSLGYTTTAEGVEDSDTLQFLTAVGCDQAQGFFISAPLPEQNLQHWLRSQPATSTYLNAQG